MDARLFLLNGRQVTNLKTGDLPLVAKAIVCVIRKQAKVRLEYRRNLPLLHLIGEGFDLYIHGADWVKILPYLEDGTLDPLQVPTRNVSILSIHDNGLLNGAYSDLYRRTLDVLELLFTTKSNP